MKNWTSPFVTAAKWAREFRSALQLGVEALEHLCCHKCGLLREGGKHCKKLTCVWLLLVEVWDKLVVHQTELSVREAFQ